jgi:periplasmic protein TonB
MGYQALLFCPDEKTARLVTHVLNDLDFSVEPCTEPFAAVKKLMAQHFDAVVVDCDNEQNATLLFKSARNSAANQSSLAVAVVEGQAGVAKAFRIGANLVLTKPINVEQAKGTLRVARGLLRKGAEASKNAPGAASSAAQTPTAPNPGSRPSPWSAPGTASFSGPPKPSLVPPPIQKPQAPSSFPSALASTQVEEPALSELDGILEADTTDDNEVLEIESPAPTAPPVAAPTSSASGTAKFPWQPAPKMAEPMASALRRAAEEAAKAESEDSPSRSFNFDAPPSAGPISASAPAPAREKTQIVVPTPPAPAAGTDAPAAEITGQRPFEKLVSAPPAERRDEPAPPTFFPGAYDPDEASGGKTKALIIVAAVVLLACSAGYLSWRNANGKSEVHSAATQSASASEPAASSSSSPQNAPASQPTQTEITLGGEPAPTKPAAAKPSLKETTSKEPVSKESASTPEPEDEPEVTQRIIVKNDTRHLAPKPASQEQEPVQAPSALELAGATDPKLPNIASAPVNVPKPAAQVVRVSQGVMEGLVLKRVAPRYPTQALQMRIQGSVQMQATISKTGDITNLKVTSGDSILGHAAQEAVKQWKYKPYYLNGEPVEIQTQILVNFKLPN